MSVSTVWTHVSAPPHELGSHATSAWQQRKIPASGVVGTHWQAAPPPAAQFGATGSQPPQPMFADVSHPSVMGSPSQLRKPGSQATPQCPDSHAGAP
jgi:hypothetical protein